MRPDVHLEGPQGRVGFVTEFAAELFLDLGHTVESLVFAEATECSVGLPTSLAVEPGWTLSRVRWTLSDNNFRVEVFRRVLLDLRRGDSVIHGFLAHLLVLLLHRNLLVVCRNLVVVCNLMVVVG